MQDHARERLARTWLRYQRVEGQHRFWAVSRAMALVDEDPEELWKVVLELVQFADTEELLCAIGAGPLEDLLRYHGPSFIDRIESEARRDRRFRIAVSCVWAWDADVRPRIDALLETLQEPRR